MTEQYINDVMDYIKVNSPDNFYVTSTTIKKNNGTELQGIVIRDADAQNNIQPILYLDGYYECDYDAEEAGMMILSEYERITESEIPFDVSQIMDYQSVKDRIFFKLINKDYNEEYLQDKPYFEIAEDLAVVFYIDVGYGATVTIQERFMDIWNVDENTLFAVARENGKQKHPAEFISIVEAIVKEYSDIDIEMMKIQSCNDDMSNDEFRQIMIDSQKDYAPMYVWRAGKDFGASVLLYDDEIERIQKQIGNRFYIIPSSISEVLVLPYREEYTVSKLKEMVASVNQTELAPEQILSENVYMVNEKGEIFIAKDAVQKMQQAVAR